MSRVKVEEVSKGRFDGLTIDETIAVLKKIKEENHGEFCNIHFEREKHCIVGYLRSEMKEFTKVLGQIVGLIIGEGVSTSDCNFMVKHPELLTHRLF